MKIKFESLQNVSPDIVESLAMRSGEAGKEALANFLRKLIQVRFESSTDFAVSTTAPNARWSEQPLKNTQNTNTKGEII